MEIRVSRLKRFMNLFVLYSLCAVAVIATYVYQVGEDNYYAGMQPWAMDALSFAVLAAGLLLIMLIVSQTKGMPSDFFLVFYSSIVVLSFLTLNSSSGAIDGLKLLFTLQLILLPLVAAWIAGKVNFRLAVRGLLSPRAVEWIIFGIVLAVAALAARNPPASAGMGIDVAGDRRMEGRDLYEAGSFMAYALSMTMNGLAPFLAYKAGVFARKWLLAAVLGFDVLFFWLIGMKAPFLYALMAYFMGTLVAGGRQRNFAAYFLWAVLLLFGLNLLEWHYFDYSLASDFFFRRVFAVQAQIQGYYADFILGSGTPSWNILTGSTGAAFQPTFYIGEFYFGDAEANANTNAFLYAFSLNGFLGYGAAALFVVALLKAFDALYRSSGNPSYLYLGFIYGLLLVEQAFTTAMVSSGVGLLFLLVLLEKHVPPPGLPPGAVMENGRGVPS